MHIIALFLLLLPTFAHAQTFGGVGTRAEGMGAAFVAVADDASATYWNPAGIATGATFDFQIARRESFIGSDLFVGASMPVLGVSVYRTHTVQTVRRRQNEGSGRVPIRPITTTNIGVTAVQSVVSAVVVGTTVRIVRGGIEPFERRTTADIDVGAMLHAGPFRAGLTARNLREPEFAGELGEVEIARQVRAGVALAPRSLPSGIHGPFTLAADADLRSVPGVEGEVRMAAVGGEYWVLAGRLGGRAGFRWNTLATQDRAFSWGLTVQLPRSVHVEGQVTRPNEGRETEWTVGTRVTF